MPIISALRQAGSACRVFVMLIDPKSGESTRVGRKRNKEGKLMRYSKKTGEEIK